MSLTLDVAGLDATGVTLISPASEDFDRLARPLAGERIAELALRLKPMLVIVSNESSQTIASFSLVWEVSHHGGTTTRFWSHTSFPELICGDGVLTPHHRAIAAGQRRIEARGVVIHGWGDLDEYFDQFLGQFVDENNTLLANAAVLRIELNGVIFADGTLEGPDDDSALFDLFSVYVAAKQDWYRGIIDALNAGRSVADAYAPVDRFLADLNDRDDAWRYLAKHPRDFWRRQAAAEATRWRRRYTDEEIPELLARSIRLEPFHVRRSARER